MADPRKGIFLDHKKERCLLWHLKVGLREVAVKDHSLEGVSKPLTFNGIIALSGLKSAGQFVFFLLCSFVAVCFLLLPSYGSLGHFSKFHFEVVVLFFQ